MSKGTGTDSSAMTTQKRREIAASIERLIAVLGEAKCAADAVAKVAKQNGALEYEPRIAEHARKIADTVRSLGIRQLRDAWSSACHKANAAVDPDEPCGICKGSGTVAELRMPGSPLINCSACRGSGKARTPPGQDTNS